MIRKRKVFNMSAAALHKQCKVESAVLAQAERNDVLTTALDYTALFPIEARDHGLDNVDLKNLVRRNDSELL